jgi:hypothetical protein
MTDRERLNAIRRKLRRMEAVLKRPASWVVKRFTDEASPRLLVAQTMALAVIRKVREAARWE